MSSRFCLLAGGRNNDPEDWRSEVMSKDHESGVLHKRGGTINLDKAFLCTALIQTVIEIHNAMKCYNDILPAMAKKTHKKQTKMFTFPSSIPSFTGVLQLFTNFSHKDAFSAEDGETLGLKGLESRHGLKKSFDCLTT